MLISHAHYDHLDLPSLEKLGKKLPVVVPRGLGGLLRKRRFESVIEVEVGETLADRRARRSGPCRPSTTGAGARSARPADPVGYVVVGLEVDLLRRRHRSLRRDERARAGRRRAHPDLGLGARARRRAPRPGAGCRGRRPAFGPSIVIPIHWGTYFPIHLGLDGKAGVRRSAPARVRRRGEGDGARRRGARPAARRERRLRRSGREQVGRAERRDRLLADLARDLRDVGAERRVRDDVEPRRLLGDVADLDVDRELVSLRNLRRPPPCVIAARRRATRRAARGARP